MDLHVELERLRRDNAQLQHTVSQLEHQVQELRVESEDLREICAAKGVDITRSTASIASEALNLLEISTQHYFNQAEYTTTERWTHGTSRKSVHPNLSPRYLEAIYFAAILVGTSASGM